MNTHCYTVMTGHTDKHPWLHSHDWTHGDEHPLLHSPDWTHGWTPIVTQSWLDSWMNTHCYTVLTGLMAMNTHCYTVLTGLMAMNTHCYTVLTGLMDEHPLLHSPDWTHGWTPIVTQSWLDSWRWTPTVTQSWLDTWRWTPTVTVLTGHMDEHPLLHIYKWAKGWTPIVTQSWTGGKDEHPLLHSHDWTHGWAPIITLMARDMDELTL